MKKYNRWIYLVFVLAGCSSLPAPDPVESPSPVPSVSVTPTPDPVPSVTPTKTETPKPLPTPTETVTPVPTPTPSVTVTPTVTPLPTPTPTAIPPVTGGAPKSPATGPAPFLSKFEADMLKFGKPICAKLQDPAVADNVKLGEVYYDGERVFFQIEAYTGDKTWEACAQAAEVPYRDGYVLKNNGGVNGYTEFSEGMTMDFLQNGDQKSKDAVILMSQKAAYASDITTPSWTTASTLSREVAYALLSYVNAEKLGAPRRARLKLLTDHGLGHIDQWFVSKSAPYMRPFMVGITAEALIRVYELTNDARILPALKTAADEMWKSTWLPNSGAFMYTDRQTTTGGMGASPDLNLLIAPLYAWLYKQTGQVSYRQMADDIFSGGVKSAYLADGKHFNQNYKWSFDYLKWRQ